MGEHFMVIGLDHVNVTAPAELEDDVVDWYATCLGLTQLKKPDGTRPKGAWFEVGAQQLHVSVDEHNPPQTAHVGLVVDELEPVIERLRERGCHIEQASAIPGRRRFYTRDPAGNRIELAAVDEQHAAIMSEESGSA